MAILRIPRSLNLRRPAAATAAALPTADVLDAFGSEAEVAPSTAGPAGTSPQSAAPPIAMPRAVRNGLAVLAVAGVLAAIGTYAYRWKAARPAATGSVSVETAPSGLPVVLDGKPVGTTPLTFALAPGAHVLHVGSGANERAVNVNVAAGASLVQRIEFAAPAAVPAATGGLRVQTEPARLPVSVDGALHGTSPIAIEDLAPGEHEVSVRTAAGVIRRAVTVRSRETVSLIVSSTATAEPAAVSAGWVSVASPVPLQFREGGKVIGTSEADRLMLPAGDHTIEFVNESLAFTTRRTVRVAAGKTVAATIDLPNGVLSLNALPWAEVWVDGERIGETPIGNLARRLGSHEVVFRHPQFGERRENVVIVADKPARLGVDMRKK